MANELTGDFDVVAEFTVPATNRVLAAMHRRERFPHSLSVSIDTRPPRTLMPDVPILLSVLDASRETISDPARLVEVAHRAPQLAAAAASAAAGAHVEQIVNAPRTAFDRVPLTPIELTGVAQVQLSAPRLEIHPDSETRMTAVTQIMVRYFAEGNSRRLPEFMRGEIRTTADVDRVASQAGDFIEVSLRSGTTKVVFNPAWPDATAYANHGHAINDAVRKLVTTSFEPTNAPLPAGQQVQFKTLPGPPAAIGVLLNGGEVPGDPASAGALFIGGDDDFALAAGKEFIVGRFNALVRPVFTALSPIQINSTLADYRVTLDNVDLELQPGQLLLVVKGHADTHSVFPNFGFTVRQALSFKLRGGTAELISVGDVGYDIDDGLADAVIGLFSGRVLGALRTARDNILKDERVQQDVRNMLSADANVGNFVGSLMNPAGKGGPGPTLSYTSFDIKPSGLVFHGFLAVPEWPPAHVEFEWTPWTAGTTIHEFSALKSWIPGGTVQKYTWWLQGRTNPLRVDRNTFVYSDAPTGGDLKLSPFGFNRPAVLAATIGADGGERRAPTLGASSFCVTVTGTRLSASGPAVEEPVSATRCGVALVPLTLVADRPAGRRWPELALAQVNSSGALEITGHVAVSPARPGEGDNPNLIVHFADERTGADLGFLTQAVRESGRTDAAAAILAVLPRAALGRSRPPEGIMVTDDPDGAWKEMFRAERSPVTLLVRPSGDVAWRHDGELPPERLASELRKRLVAGGVTEPRLVQLPVRIGHPPPNFVFSYAPGRDLTLRKLTGRPVVLVFWKSSSAPSVDTVRRLSETAGRQGAVVLAIHDGGPAEDAERAGGGRAVVVPDPDRQISRAYGVSVWPTIVYLDREGLTKDVGYGRPSGAPAGDRPGSGADVKEPRS